MSPHLFACHMCGNVCRQKSDYSMASACHNKCGASRAKSEESPLNTLTSIHLSVSNRENVYSGVLSSLHIHSKSNCLKLFHRSSNYRHPCYMKHPCLSTTRHFCDYTSDSDDALHSSKPTGDGEQGMDDASAKDQPSKRKSSAKKTTPSSGKLKKQDKVANDDLNVSNETTVISPAKIRKLERQEDNVAQPLLIDNESHVMKPVNCAEIKEYLQTNDIAYSDGHTCYITTCQKYVLRRMLMRQMNKMFINMTTGYFVCLSCKKNGSWQNFVDNTNNILSIPKNTKIPDCFSTINVNDVIKETSRAKQIWDSCVPPRELPEEDLQNVRHVLGIENLTLEVLEKYKVRFFKDQNGIALPHFGLNGQLSELKTIAEELVTNKDDNERMKITTKYYASGDFNGLFGLDTIDPKHTEAVLTTTEFDAMAVRQATGALALALPKKDSTLPQKVLPLLEQFSKLVLWFGGNVKTWESAKLFSKKLNPNRCHLIRPDEKQPAPLVALNNSMSLRKILKATQPVVHKSITSFRLLRQEVYNQLAEADLVAGTKWDRYVQLNKILKGHRRGELTIVTGPTGSGKTTFISDYSLDLCMQGVNTLWGSFEINNVRLIRTMLMQYSQTNLVKNLDQFDHWADQFQHLPMQFMTFHGQENIKTVIETMSHAVYVHDIAHVIVDNLQFMMGSDASNPGSNAASERFIKQDHIIGAFRQFATNKNCHVTMVIHPRKERETEELTVSSIFGGAKASQEADNIMIIQDRRAVSVKGRKYIQISKNRYDGELGIVLLKFDSECLRYNMKPTELKKEKDDKVPAEPGQSENTAESKL